MQEELGIVSQLVTNQKICMVLFSGKLKLLGKENSEM